jgi:hypothetical protein
MGLPGTFSSLHCSKGLLPAFTVHGFTWYFCQPSLFQGFIASLHCSWVYLVFLPAFTVPRVYCQPSLFMGLPGIFASLHCSKGLLPPSLFMGRVFNGISFREIFAKRKRNKFRNFAKKEHFREILCVAKMSF